MRAVWFAVSALCAAVGCSSGAGHEYVIVAASGSGSGALTAVAGDGIALAVVEKTAAGTMQALPAGVTVTWTKPGTVIAAAPGTTPQSLLPAPGAQPIATFISNEATRPDITDDITGVVFVLDAGTGGAGTLEVSATVSTEPDKPVAASISVTSTPAGNAARGQGEYLSDCSNCHGGTGDGTMVGSNGMYNINGADYPYPAPALNAKSVVAGSASWNAALLAFASRSDVNNLGVAQRVPMPNWMVDLAQQTQKPPTTQELADIWAYLVTETQ